MFNVWLPGLMEVVPFVTFFLISLLISLLALLFSLSHVYSGCLFLWLVRNCIFYFYFLAPDQGGIASEALCQGRGCSRTRVGMQIYCSAPLSHFSSASPDWNVTEHQQGRVCEQLKTRKRNVKQRDITFLIRVNLRWTFLSVGNCCVEIMNSCSLCLLVVFMCLHSLILIIIIIIIIIFFVLKNVTTKPCWENGCKDSLGGLFRWRKEGAINKN